MPRERLIGCYWWDRKRNKAVCHLRKNNGNQCCVCGLYVRVVTCKRRKAGDQRLTPEVTYKTKIQEDLQLPVATLKGLHLRYE